MGERFPIEPENLSPSVLRALFESRTYDRGLGYFHQGRAHIVDTHTDRQGRLVLSASSRGSGGRVYQQTVLIAPGSRGAVVQGDCTCPMAFDCKHVVAACLAWQAQARAAGPSGDGFERWLARYGQGHEPEHGTSGEALLYLLSQPPRGRSGVQVGFVIARRKRDGEWGKGRSAAGNIMTYHFGSPPRYLGRVDTEVLALLRSSNPYLWDSSASLGGRTGRMALNLMLQTGRVFWGPERRGPLVEGEARPLSLAWRKRDGQYRLRLEVTGGARLLPVSPPCYLDPEALTVGDLQLPEGLDAERLAVLAEAPAVAEAEADRVSRQLVLHHPELPTPAPVAVEEVRGPPTPRLSLHLDPERPWGEAMSLAFLYAGQALEAGDSAPVVTRETSAGLQRIHRDRDAEAAARQRLVRAGAVEAPGSPGFALVGPDAGRQAALDAWFRFLEGALPQLEAEGWAVVWARDNPVTLSRAETIDAEVASEDNDWFSLRFDLEADGQRLPLLPLVSELLADYRPGSLPETLYLEVGQGHFVSLPGERLAPVLETIVGLFDRESRPGEDLRLSRLDAPRLLELGEATRVHGAGALQRMARRLRDFEGVKVVKPPTTFRGELRAYQQRGLDWLQFLREYDLAGILADDMGLGKTVQTLAHLAVEKRAGRLDRPCLIVAPTSLLGNWRREAAEFTPKLRVLVLHGPGRKGHFDALADHDLVLTTYPLLPRDREALLAQPWHYLILDEAQQVKNPNAQAAQVVRTLTTRHRLCLTGTPMENHLGELWAQFDFLLPGFLGDRQDFARRYRTPIEKWGDGERLAQLNRRVAPFMLRRTKDVVAAELPAKSELVRSVAIEGRQAALYESIRLTMEKRVREAIAQKGLARSHITILDALLKLRQVCCDPRLLPAGTKGAKGAASAKLQMLMDLLPEMLEEGRRILLFSQFTTMLGLIEKELSRLDVSYTKLTGQTRKRDAAIDAFRRGDANLFLISLKAGGTGLNLTEADTVIHYDPWWNPAVETQASDRAHRIGQDKPVFVYKLITEGTVEEKILALQERKRKLADNVYGKGRKAGDLPIDAETIEALLAAP